MSEVTRQETGQGGRKVLSTSSVKKESKGAQESTMQYRRVRRVVKNVDGSDIAGKEFDNLPGMFSRDSSRKSSMQDVQIMQSKDEIDAGKDCKCKFREEEKRMLQELNDKHLSIIANKQNIINCLQMKVDNLSNYRDVFVQEDRLKLEETIKMLERRIMELDREKEELGRISSSKDWTIDDLERKRRELETTLARREEKLKIIEELNQEIVSLRSSNSSAQDKINWLTQQRDQDKERYDSLLQKEFSDRWDMIMSKIEKGCDGQPYFEDMKNRLEELRNSFKDKEAMDVVRSKFKEQISYLEQVLEEERRKVREFAGQNAEMKCKVEGLENQFSTSQKENSDMKQRLQDEKAAYSGWVSEKEVEIAQLMARIEEMRMFEGCLDDCPVSFKTEIDLYSQLLEGCHTAEVPSLQGKSSIMEALAGSEQKQSFGVEQSSGVSTYQRTKTRTTKISNVGLSTISSS